MTEFKLVKHGLQKSSVVEIWSHGELVGVLYPAEWGVRLVSKYMNEDSVVMLMAPPPVLEVRLP